METQTNKSGPNILHDPVPRGTELYSKEVEQCLLGSMMAGPDECMGLISQTVQPLAFFYPEHRILFEAIATVYRKGAVDFVLLRDYLKQERQLDAVHGVQYFIDLITELPSAANWEFYRDSLLEYYDKRNIAAAIKKMQTIEGEPQEQKVVMQEIVDGIELAGKYNGDIVLQKLSDIPDRPLVWFWDQKIPDCGVSMLQGDPGVSKSYLSTYMAAMVSTGRPWPDCPDIPVARGSVVIFSGEDDCARIRERCNWMGADMDAVRLVTPGKRLLDIRYDLNSLQAQINALPVKCRLLIFDPITSYMGSCKQNNNNEVRTALEPLSEFAVENRLCIILINHMNKKQGEKYVYRGLGSMGFTAVCRSVWGIVFDESDLDHETRLFCMVKNNYSRIRSGLKYRIINNAIEFDREPFLGDIDEMSGKAKEGRDSKQRQAADLIQELLEAAGEAVPSVDIMEAGEAAGFKKGTMFHASKLLDIKKTKDITVRGQWLWELKSC